MATLPVDEVMARIDLGFFHFRLLFVCGFGFAAAAVEVILTGFLFPELRKHWDLDEFSLGALPTIVSFGSILGELGWGIIADKYGRRWVFMVTVVITVVFGIASAFSPGLRTFYVLRFFVGIGYGGNIAVDFTVFTELLPTSGRGRMLFYMAAFWAAGQTATSGIAWVVIPRLGWRGFLVVCALPSLITAFLRPLIPESPRWLILHGQETQAAEVCRDIARCNGLKPEDVGLHEGVRLTLENEASQLLAASTYDEEGKGAANHSFCDNFECMLCLRLFSRPLWRTTAGLCFLVAGLGFGGYATVTFMPTFLTDRGFPEGGVYQTMLMNSLSEFPGLFLAGIVATHIGRRIPLQLALPLSAASLAIFAEANTKAWIMVSTCLASGFLEFGWALFHVYTAEAFPTELRATAAGFISAVGSIISMFSPLVGASLIMSEADPSRVAIYFCSIIGAFALVAGILFHLETKDRDLADVATQLDKPTEDRSAGSYAT